MLVGPLRAPDDSCGGSRGIETGMGSMSLVGTAKLTMDGGIEFAVEFDQDQDQDQDQNQNQNQASTMIWNDGMMA